MSVPPTPLEDHVQNPNGDDVPPAPPASRRLGGRERAIGGLVACALVTVVVATLRLPPPDAAAELDPSAVSLQPAPVGDTTATRTPPASVAVKGNDVATVKPGHSTSPVPVATPATAPTPSRARVETPISPKAAASTDTAPRVATIIVSGMPAEAELRVDGHVRSGRRLKVDAGRHVLTVAFGGRIARTDTLNLQRNEARSWTPRIATPAPVSHDVEKRSASNPTPAVGNAPPRGKNSRESACEQNVATQSWADANTSCSAEAAKGDATAKRQLGLIFQQGKGVRRNDDIAAGWFSGAASGGDIEGMYQFAQCLDRGRGIKKDQASAMMWYSRAGEGGHAAAQYAVGDAYEHGKLGAKKDKAQSLHWYQMAAAQHYKDAADRVRSLSR